MKLNPRQREAVIHIHGPLLVLAGAGSGKTSVITQKLAHLIRDCGYDARHVVAVTFTNKAAREMNERARALLGRKDVRGLRICTFHNFGLQFLRKELAATPLRAGFTILDEQDTLSLVKELLPADLAADRAYTGELQQQISRWKNELLSPEQALASAADAREADWANFYKRYQRSLTAYNAVDFDDLIRLPVQLLQTDETVRERWQRQLHYLMVDEYQDTNTAQYHMLRLLVGKRAHFTVVGDDDQSIYAWRGANPENLVQLKKDFPQLDVIMLEQNYRSTGRILKAANQLIARNPHLFEKTLWSDHDYGPPIRVLQVDSETQEAERVAGEIIRRHFNEGLDYGDVAILYRGNHQARWFEQALMQNRIPYRISGGTSFFARAEIKDVMAYLRLLANEDDDTAFLRVINTPRREIGPGTLEKVAAHAAAHNVSLLASLRLSPWPEGLGARRSGQLRSFLELVDTARERLRKEAPSEVVRQLLVDLDYESWLLETSSSDKSAAFRWRNVCDLVDWLERLSLDEEGQAVPLDAMVQKLMLFDRLDRLTDDTSEGEVQLMTLHAAKGLEFPLVFLVGMEEELLPHRTSLEDGNIDEERRLCYVGITRARQELVLTLTRYRQRYGEKIECLPSRFLEELPQEDLLWETPATRKSEAEQAQTNEAHLAALRAMLGKSGAAKS